MHIQEIHYVGAKLDLQWDLSLNPNVRSGLEEMHSQVQDIFPHGEERFHVSDPEVHQLRGAESASPWGAHVAAVPSCTCSLVLLFGFCLGIILEFLGLYYQGEKSFCSSFLFFPVMALADLQFLTSLSFLNVGITVMCYIAYL